MRDAALGALCTNFLNLTYLLTYCQQSTGAPICTYVVRRFEVVDVVNTALVVRCVTLHVVDKYRRIVDHLSRVHLTRRYTLTVTYTGYTCPIVTSISTCFGRLGGLWLASRLVA